jgi:hypothetical protein
MRYGHRFDRFARMVAQQSVKVAMRPKGLILALKERRKSVDIAGQVGDQRFDIA